MSMYIWVVVSYIFKVIGLYDIIEGKAIDRKRKRHRLSSRISQILGHYLGQTAFKKCPAKLHIDQNYAIVSVTAALLRLGIMFVHLAY